MNYIYTISAVLSLIGLIAIVFHSAVDDLKQADEYKTNIEDLK